MTKISFAIGAGVLLISSPVNLALAQTTTSLADVTVENRLTCQTRICAYRFEEGRSVATMTMHSPEPYYYDRQSIPDGTWPQEEIDGTGQ
jgi:hypothetical protein